MIHFLLLQNRQGKTRLAKFYSAFEHDEKRQLQTEVHKLITKRDPKFTNFVEVTTATLTTPSLPLHRSLVPSSPQPLHAPLAHAPLCLRLSRCVSPQFRRYKVIYRRYAGLYLSYCVDVNDNELAYLESIHLLVELLDKYFTSVTELDLVFNFHKVYTLLDETYLGGEIQETSKRVILERLQEIERLD